MVKCAAKYCNGETNNPANFFRFPSSSFQTRRSLWVQKTCAKISPNDNECYLCPKHFGPEQFRNRSLRWDAVPSLYGPEPSQNSDETVPEEIIPSVPKVKHKRGRKKAQPAKLQTDSEELSNDSLSHLQCDKEEMKPAVERPRCVLVIKQRAPNVYHSQYAPSLSPSLSPPPRIPTPPPPVPEQLPPPPTCNDGIVDFEAEIDRLKDPLCERPVKKRKDEDVRTRFTEEDDIPLHRLFTGVKKANAFNTDLPLPSRLPFPTPQPPTPPKPTDNGDKTITDKISDDFIINGTETEEPESILGDTPTYALEEPMTIIIPAVDINPVQGAEKEDNNKKQENNTVSECFSLCSHCDFYASSEENLREHEKKAHSSGNAPGSKVYPFKILTKCDGSQFYLCDFCNFSGKTMALLVGHMVVHFPKENDKGLSIQKYCATIAVSGKNTKDIVTVSMNGSNGDAQQEIVEIDDDDDEDMVMTNTLDKIVIAKVTGGVEVNKMFPKSKRKSNMATRTSPRKRK